jgi:pteridine reductase
MRIVLHYHSSADKAQATLDDLAALGVDATVVTGDLAQVAEAERIIDEAQAHWGQLDVLVCSAGIWNRTPLGNVTVSQWDDLFAVNARSAFFMAQRAAPHLRAAQGSMVAIADIGITWSWKDYTPYLSSKAALAMTIKNLAHDLAPEVRVNGIAPGPILLPDNWNDKQHDRAARSTLLGRVGRAEDVADSVLFLAQADYITGVVLPVDGGQRLK